MNSILMVDKEKDILIDTYGSAFDYYPKILNWSAEEKKAHMDFVSNMNDHEDVARSWLDYFEKKRRFGNAYVQQLKITR